MNNAEKYFEEQMKNSEFAESFFKEKYRLDLEFLIDELIENIKADKPKDYIIEKAGQLKRKLNFA